MAHHTTLARDRFGEPYFDRAGHRYRLSRALGGWIRTRIDASDAPRPVALRTVLEQAPTALRDATLTASFEAVAALAAGVQDLALREAASPWARGERLDTDAARLGKLTSELQEATRPPVWLALVDAETDPSGRAHLRLAVDNTRPGEPDGSAA